VSGIFEICNISPVTIFNAMPIAYSLLLELDRLIKNNQSKYWALVFLFGNSFSVWLTRLPDFLANYIVPQWPFSELICTVVASENRNIFIARCYWRNQLWI